MKAVKNNGILNGELFASFFYDIVNQEDLKNFLYTLKNEYKIMNNLRNNNNNNNVLK